MTPQTFQDLKNLIKLNNIPKKSRSSSSQKLYEAYLNYVPELTKDLILKAQISEPQTKYNIFTSSLTLNQFPYDLLIRDLPNTHHYILWYNDWKLDGLSIEKLIFDWIFRLFDERLEFCFLTNQNRSLPQHPHTHVFINFEK